MAITRTTNEQFWKFGDNLPNWHHLYNANIDILLETVAKLNALQDVDVKSLVNGSIIQYNSSTSKWEVVGHRRL